MKLKLSHLLVLLSGVIVVFLLSLLPKYVVSDKEKRLKATEQKVKEQITQNNAQHGGDDVDIKLTSALRDLIEITDLPEKLVLVDSLATIYKDAFVLDSAVTIYLEFAPEYKGFYLKAIRDGLTGLRMSPNDEKKQYYARLCKRVVDNGLKADSLNLELQVEALRLKVFSAAMNGIPPMEGIFQLKDLVAENPSLLVGRVALAEFYTTVGKTEDAIQQYLQVLDYEKDNLQAHVELVSLYLGTNKNALAKEYTTRLQEINKVAGDSFIEDFVQKSLKKLN